MSVVQPSPRFANLAQLDGFSWDVRATHFGSALKTSRVPFVLRYTQPSGAVGATAATQPGVSSQICFQASKPPVLPL
jgi:hypothetical protein